jgi:hypothetical protein
MIELNVQTGAVLYQGILLYPDMRMLDFLNSKIKIQLLVDNAGYKRFKLSDYLLTRVFLVVEFFEGKMNRIDVFTEYDITPKESLDQLRFILNLVGGEKVYNWGCVKLLEDVKTGGVKFISIDFN